MFLCRTPGCEVWPADAIGLICRAQSLDAKLTAHVTLGRGRCGNYFEVWGGGGNVSRGPRLPLPKIKKLLRFGPLFFGRVQVVVQK